MRRQDKWAARKREAQRCPHCGGATAPGRKQCQARIEYIRSRRLRVAPKGLRPVAVAAPMSIPIAFSNHDIMADVHEDLKRRGCSPECCLAGGCSHWLEKEEGR